MITLKFEVHRGEENMKEDYKRFVKVQDQYASYNVPTKEEYEDLIEKLRKTQKDFETRFFRIAQKGISLEDRIAALEKENESEKPELHTQTLLTGLYGMVEVTGTPEQFTTFRGNYTSRCDAIALALDCGLSVKKVEEK